MAKQIEFALGMRGAPPKRFGRLVEVEPRATGQVFGPGWVLVWQPGPNASLDLSDLETTKAKAQKPWPSQQGDRTRREPSSEPLKEVHLVVRYLLLVGSPLKGFPLSGL